jgi:hypothetical protein
MLYLFFARLFAVWSEVRQPRTRGMIEQPPLMPVAGAAAERRDLPMKGRGTVPGRLVVLEPKQKRGTAYAISGVIGIGREADNTIPIADDTYLSGHHAKVSAADGRVIVDDLGLRNGTYLNGPHHRAADRQGRRPDPDRLHRVRGPMTGSLIGPTIVMSTRTR